MSWFQFLAIILLNKWIYMQTNFLIWPRQLQILILLIYFTKNKSLIRLLTIDSFLLKLSYSNLNFTANEELCSHTAFFPISTFLLYVPQNIWYHCMHFEICINLKMPCHVSFYVNDWQLKRVCYTRPVWKSLKRVNLL